MEWLMSCSTFVLDLAQSVAGRELVHGLPHLLILNDLGLGVEQGQQILSLLSFVFGFEQLQLFGDDGLHLRHLRHPLLHVLATDALQAVDIVQLHPGNFSRSLIDIPGIGDIYYEQGASRPIMALSMSSLSRM